MIEDFIPGKYTTAKIQFGKFIEKSCKACGIPLEILQARFDIDKLATELYQQQKLLQNQVLTKHVYEQWLAEEIAAGHI